MNSARNAPVMIILTEECRRKAFIREFFDPQKPLTNTFLSENTGPLPCDEVASSENTAHTISPETALLIVKKIKDKSGSQRTVESNALREMLKKILEKYFTPNPPGPSHIRACFDFLDQLLQCEKSYRITKGRKRDLFGENTDKIRRVIQALRLQIKNDWQDLNENPLVIHKVVTEVISQHGSDSDYALHIEQTIINKSNLYLERVSDRFRVIRSNIENLLKKRL
jgi:tRNA(Ile)-lysidine synthase TilS/MesJ